MQAIEFKYLPLASKIQWIYLEGEFLMDIRYYEFKVNLYRIRGFMVEVFFDHKRAQISSVKLLDRRSSRMKFYADQVKLATD